MKTAFKVFFIAMPVIALLAFILAQTAPFAEEHWSAIFWGSQAITWAAVAGKTPHDLRHVYQEMPSAFNVARYTVPWLVAVCTVYAVYRFGNVAGGIGVVCLAAMVVAEVRYSVYWVRYRYR